MLRCRSVLSMLVLSIAVASCDESRVLGPNSENDLGNGPEATGLSANNVGANTYKVTIENLTSSQPFSPGVVLTHGAGVNLFQPGVVAEGGIELIAENGDPSLAVAQLGGAPGVTELVATTAPIHRIGGPGPTSLMLMVTGNPGDKLSLAVMLICTNDGFVGLNSVDLPSGPGAQMFMANSYDAGSEVNDELFSSIVPPCGAIGPVMDASGSMNGHTREFGVVQRHEGIKGVGDLEPDHGWQDPVAKVTIELVSVPQVATYEVTIENITTSQPFSPGVVLTHTPSVTLFQPGMVAEGGIEAIAENGDPSLAVTQLGGASGVTELIATTAPIHRIGGPGATSLSVMVTANPGDKLSLAVMLICTNDGFVGLNAVDLPTGFDPVVVGANSYDSGSEVNDELFSSIVPPCGGIGPVPDASGSMNGHTREFGVVQLHEGIKGVGDLDPGDHGWTDPVANVTIRRIS